MSKPICGKYASGRNKPPIMINFHVSPSHQWSMKGANYNSKSVEFYFFYFNSFTFASLSLANS